MASRELEKLLAAMFDAEFAPPNEKRQKEQARDELLKESAERAGIPCERLKAAILSTRYREYRRLRLVHELPDVPPPLRTQ